MKTEPDWFYKTLEEILRYGILSPATYWQSQDVSNKPEMNPVELLHKTLSWEIDQYIKSAQYIFNPNLPWAEDHFQERVSGQPLNPPPSEAYWPFARQQNTEHKEVEGSKFSHTYPERFWPKHARGVMDDFHLGPINVPIQGIRYDYGDLHDVVNLLRKNPLTRQAYLPVWFPEDTGATGGQRVPCTLGYQFLIRGNLAFIIYHIRSCDALRHLKDDAYMAARLLQWVVEKVGLSHVYPHQLIMYISSLHIFEGDLPMVRNMLEDYDDFPSAAV